jgi:hypothetical protein
MDDLTTFYLWPYDSRTDTEPTFAADSAYVRTCYLPVLGPTATHLLAQIGGIVATSGRWSVPFADLAASMGINGSTTRKALKRLECHHLADALPDGWAVRPAAPPLSRKAAAGLPPHVAAYEESIFLRRYGNAA